MPGGVENDASSFYCHPSRLEGKVALKEGDVVKLKSGNAEMIVAKAEQIGEQTVVSCVWFDEDHRLRRTAFPADALELPKLK
jgi:uncharacterized protein YodC (DUF2158 family)